MKMGVAITDLPNLTGTSCFRGSCAFVLVICFCSAAAFASGQKPQKPKENGAKVSVDEARSAANQQEVIARLFGIVNELKSETDKPAATLLQSEIADVLWRFDEPSARSIFRLAFDTLRQASPNSSSSSDSASKRLSLKQSRRWTSAINTILKRYGLHDRKSAEAWLKELENEIKAERTSAANSDRISQAQAELLAEMALGELSSNPKEAQRLGLLALTAGQVPMGLLSITNGVTERGQGSE